MSLWTRVNQLPQSDLDKIQLIYGDNFPIEVRHYLAEWIEDRLLNAPIYSNDQENTSLYEQEAARFLNQLIMELEQKVVSLPDNCFTIKIRLHEAARNFNHLFAHNPTQLYRHMINCLHHERQCVESPEVCVNLQNPEETEVLKAIQHLQSMVRLNDSENCNLMKEYEKLHLEVFELQKTRAYLDNMEDTEMRVLAHNQHAQHQAMVNDRRQLVTGKRLALVESFRKTILMTGEAQSKVLDKHLLQWKLYQGFARNGASMLSVTNLDTIQAWCESLAEVNWNTRVQIRLAIKNKSQQDVYDGAPDLLLQALNDVTSLLKTLIINSFIIEKQPPQVLKTNTRFAATVRLLVGNALNIQMVDPLVKASIISEAQVQQIQQTGIASEQSCGEIMNNIGKLSDSLKHMQLKKIKRNVKQRANECVTDEKFALLFQSCIPVGDGDLVYSVWTISLPMVVIVHGNQEPQSWATITWDNAFADMNRVPFQVVDKVNWNVLVEVLNVKFRATTGSSLTAESRHFMCEKVFMRTLPTPVPNDLTITWSQFCKEPLPCCKFTFWNWFYAAMKVTRDHLPGMAGCTVGFMHKSKAEDYLLKCPRGTFLLRYSESELGAVTIAYVNEGSDGQPQILHIQPFTAKNLSTLSLSDRILDIDDLLFLFPNKPKHEVFHRHTALKGWPRNKNYIATVMRNVLMPITNNTQTNSFINTPSNNMRKVLMPITDNIQTNSFIEQSNNIQVPDDSNFFLSSEFHAYLELDSSYELENIDTDSTQY